MRAFLRELAREDPTEAPADQADLATVLAGQLHEALAHRAEHARPKAEVAALTPAVRAIAQAAQEAAQDRRAVVARGEPGEHEHRMAVAARCQAPHRHQRERCAGLEPRAALQQLQGGARCAGTARVASAGHGISPLARERPLSSSDPASAAAAIAASGAGDSIPRAAGEITGDTGGETGAEIMAETPV